MEIEDILKNFPIERVRKVKKFYENAYFVEDMKRQIYKAHQSSCEIWDAWWQAESAMAGIAYLLDYINEDELKKFDLEIIEKVEKYDEEKIDEIMKKIFSGSRLRKMFSHMKKEKFRGHIPLITGIYALGAKAIFCQYLNSVCNILEKLHGNSKYRKQIGNGKDFWEWDECMLLKTFVYLKKK